MTRVEPHVRQKCRSMKLKREPIRISKTAWYYEEEDGLAVVSELRALVGGAYVGTVITKIPWWKVERSVRRHKAQGGQ